MKKNKPTSLYIHIPFCEHICDYCDFPKLQYFHLFAEKYLKMLQKELLETVGDNYHLQTIYIGGGTPTSLEDPYFEELLLMLEPYSKEVKEYTVEANPESLSLTKIKLMKKHGVNRVSLGVESTDNEVLKDINRHHSYDDVIKAFSNLRDNDITNINVDLILGLPNTNISHLQKDLERLLKLKPTHLSTYSLTVHPHTMFYLRHIEEPEDDYSRTLYDYVHNTLSNNGFIHYEISNFSVPGYESKHNYVYWKNEEYYGIGLGACGYIGGHRYANTVNLDKYLNGKNTRKIEIVSKKDNMEYLIMLRLRTIEGIDLDEFFSLFGFDLYIQKKNIIDNYISSGFLLLKNRKLKPTYEGMMILDKIILDLI